MAWCIARIDNLKSISDRHEQAVRQEQELKQRAQESQLEIAIESQRDTTEPDDPEHQLLLLERGQFLHQIGQVALVGVVVVARLNALWERNNELFANNSENNCISQRC